MKASIWTPFRYKAYLIFWSCAFLSNIGTWVQDVAAGWVMTHLSVSPLTISLLSFSTSLPTLMLSLPVGFLSDRGHRQKILILAQIGMFLASVSVCAMAFGQFLSPTLLVSMTFLLGVGFALTGPAFQSVLSDLVEPQYQAEAVLAYYMGINISRVLGPSLAGFIVGNLGPQWAFAFNAVSYSGLLIFFFKWKDHQGPILTEFPKADLFSPAAKKLWIEIFCVTFFASALWALYPSKGRIELGLDSFHYGLLLGFFGLGACIVAFFGPVFFKKEAIPWGKPLAYLIFAAGMYVVSRAHGISVILAGMALCGAGWLMLATLMNIASRTLSPESRLKATSLGAFFTVFYAGMSLGAISWGIYAKSTSVSKALLVAAVGLVLVSLTKFIQWGIKKT